MADEPTESTPVANEADAPAPVPASPPRRFRHREIDQADGTRLVLGADGRIVHLDAEGATTGSWAPDDPDWPRLALRFGLRPQRGTVAPHGPDTGGRDRPW